MYRRAVPIRLKKTAGDPIIRNQRSETETPPTPIAWTIAGSDSGGGAGIQADLKTMNAFGVHGCSVVTALTAQNTLGVDSIESLSGTMLRAQIDALTEDLPPVALKTGMLGNAEICDAVAGLLENRVRFQGSPVIVCDPVLKSSSGTPLLDDEAMEILIHRILPRVDVLTPNLPEAEALLGRKFETVESAAEQILELGPGSVLIKGGHAEGNECRDSWTDGQQALWLSSPRVETRHTHGTGCILSAAITAAIALGQTIPEAAVAAKTFLNQCLKLPVGIGAGHGPMRIELFRDKEEDRPHVKTS